MHLGLLDAIYRCDANGKPLYTKKLVHSPVHADDRKNYEPRLRQEIRQLLSAWKGLEVRVFCPLAIGEHVDHMIVRSAVESVYDSRNLIYFEDFPYVIKSNANQPQLQLNNNGENWRSTIFELTSAEMEARIVASACYVSQIPKMFPSILQHWQNRVMVHWPMTGRYLNWSTDLNGACKRMALSIKSYTNHVEGEGTGRGMGGRFLSSEIAKSATSSFNWNLAGSFVRYGAGFIINIVLARILGPGPFWFGRCRLYFYLDWQPDH